MAATSYIAKPLLEIDGKKASDKLIDDILLIEVEESLHLPSAFTIVIRNDYFEGRGDTDEVWRYDKNFSIGNKIKIGFVSSTTDDAEFSDAAQGTVFDGEITAVEAQFNSQGQAPVIVRGYDLSHRLHRGRYNRSFQDMSDTDILKKVVGEVGIQVGKADSSGSAHKYVFQENQTNMEFLRERAARIGFELFVQDGKLNFRKPSKGTTIELEWLQDVHSFRVRATSAEQVSGVEVRGWDVEKKAAIVAKKTSPSVLTSTDLGEGKKTSTAFDSKPSKPTTIVVDRPTFTQKEADTMAQALADELGGEFIRAEAKGEGNPDIRPGKVVKLKNMGKYSGHYYITETRHVLSDRVYSTEFEARGLRNGDLLSILSPPTRLQPGQTFLVGKVTNNNDPKKWGRVRVKFPTLTEEHESNWARVVAIGAGKNRGFDCLPEVDDEVLVGFEHGDIHRPFVMGGLWNGKDAPPEKVTDSVADGKVRLRTVKTRTGHQLQFVEEDKGSTKKGTYLDTAGGHKLYLNDSDKSIEVKTNGGHVVKMDDQGKKIEIKTGQGSNSVVLNGSSNAIDIKAGTSINLTVGSNKISIKASGIEISASGIVTVKGSLIKLN
ncbi:MAG: VgrG-related protein [Cyanobacteria bacterium P01_E01_bin.45]